MNEQKKLEQYIAELPKRMQYGRFTVFVQAGKPIRVEEEIKNIKLDTDNEKL